MRNLVTFLLLIMASVGPLAAQPTALRPHPDVPATFDVAGVHLVLSDEAQRLVQQKADGLCRHQPSFQARVDLADAAFPIIDRVLKEEGVPLDFRYLVLQESALQGDARSPHEAVGYWQLKQETATCLGLLVSAEVDERQHLTTSTRAAARYLTRSNTSLHNWLDALLSYNTGLGGVKPYTLPTDFDATEMAITEATAPYVLMFLAQKIAFEPACGLNPKPALRLLEFPAVAGQTLETQALTLHVAPAALAMHNHWLLAPVVPTDRPYTLIVPVGDVTQVAGIVASQRLQSRGQLLTVPAVAANTAEVRINNLRALIALPGETTADLARRAHQRLGEFLHHNELTGFDVAVAGRPYYLESKRDDAALEYHVLQPSETVFDVAQKYGLRQKAIYTKNRMARVEELRPGRVLWLKHTRPREVAIEYRSQLEGVALEGSSAAVISIGNDVLVEQLNEVVPARRPESEQVTKVKIKIKNGSVDTRRVVVEDHDGWGEVLTTATATAAIPAPVVSASSRPVASAPLLAAAHRPLAASSPPRPASAKVTYLPPPIATPVPAPLNDELRESDSTEAIPVVRRLAAAPRPAPKPAKVAVAAAPKPLVTPAPAALAATETTHRVEPHETVYSISRRYQIPPATLISLNHLAPPAGLTVGQVLLVKVPQQESAPVVKSVLRPVQTPVVSRTSRVNSALYVPKKIASAAPVATVAATPVPVPAPVATVLTPHTVAKGETLYSIARLYKVTVADLQAWNAKPDISVKIGEVLRVSGSRQ